MSIHTTSYEYCVSNNIAGRRVMSSQQRVAKRQGMVTLRSKLVQLTANRGES